MKPFAAIFILALSGIAAADGQDAPAPDASTAQSTDSPAQGPQVSKDHGCTLADFKGTYGFTVVGPIQPGLAISGAFGRLGKVIADGAGSASSITLADYHGTYQVEELDGPYTVTDGCYLSWVTFLASVNTYVVFEGVLTGSGKAQVMVATPPGAALIGFLEKQSADGCQQTDLSSTYSLKLTGEVEPGLPISGPFGRTGQVAFDASSGTAAATTIASYAGLINPENFTGSYTISSDCHLTFQATLPPPAGFPITLEGVISADKSHVQLMITAPTGAVVLGDMTKQ